MKLDRNHVAVREGEDVERRTYDRAAAHPADVDFDRTYAAGGYRYGWAEKENARVWYVTGWVKGYNRKHLPRDRAALVGAVILFVALFVLAAWCEIAHAASDDWTQADTKRELLFDSLLLVDTGQTLTIADTPQYRELDTVCLPARPTRGAVYGCSAVWALVHYSVARSLPASWRFWWQSIAIGGHALAVAHNNSAGIPVDPAVVPAAAVTFTYTWRF